jgi:hypothetical protein
MTSLWLNSEGPDSIPLVLNIHLVTQCKFDPDYMASLQCAQRVDFVGDDAVVFFRLFDPTKVPGNVVIENYIALDDHPELIHYEGHIDPKNQWINVVPGTPLVSKPTPELKPPQRKRFSINLFRRR